MPNVGGMFGDIKAKLGFRGNNAAQQDMDTYEEYDEYADYGDYGEDDYDDYDSRGFGNRNRVTTRDASSSLPRLVSFSDARASTRFTESSTAGAPARYSRPSSGSMGRTMVDSSLPTSMTPEGSAQVSAAASRRREGGLDSLFSSTSPSADVPQEDIIRQPNLPIIGAAASGAAGAAGAYDPYDAYNGSGSSYSAQRRVTVLKPMSYGDVENVAKTLKAGDAVVLDLKATRDDLSKRILDFSFGVASALDASVDCISDKVFAITRGAALSDAERASLRL